MLDFKYLLQKSQYTKYFDITMLTPINPHFGVDVAGSVKDYTTNDRDYLINLLIDYKFVRFKQQQLEHQDLVKFTEILGVIWSNDNEGSLSGNMEQGKHHADTTKITRVNNIDGVLRDFEVNWHSDVSHKPWQSAQGCMPSRVLYAHQIHPDEQATTSWFDQEWLYNQCDPELRNQLKQLQVILQAPYKTIWERNIVPFVLENPVTKKLSVTLQSKLFLAGFVNLAPAQAEQLLNRLFELALQPENVITHHWCTGDLVFYNNYNTAHYREKLTTKHPRTLWRTTFQVPELIPAAIRPEII